MEIRFVRSRLAFCFLLGFIVLAGCTTKSLRSGSSPSEIRQSGRQYLELANKSIPLQALEYRLQATLAFIQVGDIQEAQRILRECRSNTYVIDPYLSKSILNARLALLNKDPSKAAILLRSTLRSLNQDPNSYTAASRNASSGTPHIALLLPSKGPHLEAAKTVRDGFLAAYYQSLQHLPSDASVKIYDTGEGSEIREAYQKALDDNATFIVGPLTKPEVQAMATLRLSIPVLALNTISDDPSLPIQLYQFGLMPEDEVISVADHALRQGHRNTLILAVQGEWGKRLVQTFKQYWGSKNGNIVETQYFKPGKDLDSKIQTLLRVKNTERRQDVDMIFIAAPADIARQIKPLLNFYYAESLPVYATSSVYGGIPSQHKDQDLNGIRFCDMPWIINQSAEKQKGNASNAPRFFALGLDAYRLAILLGKTEGLPSYGFSGYTGELRQVEGNRIQRGLVCARFEQGVPVPD